MSSIVLVSTVDSTQRGSNASLGVKYCSVTVQMNVIEKNVPVSLFLIMPLKDLLTLKLVHACSCVPEV